MTPSRWEVQDASTKHTTFETLNEKVRHLHLILLNIATIKLYLPIGEDLSLSKAEMSTKP